MQAVLDGILSRYNQIRHQITNGTFESILWRDADGTAIGTDWAEGFMQGVGLSATKWERLLRSEDGAGLIFPILALCGHETGESLLLLKPEDEATLRPEQRHSWLAALWRSTITGDGESRRMAQQKSQIETMLALADPVISSGSAAADSSASGSAGAHGARDCRPAHEAEDAWRRRSSMRAAST
jgi:hypothetical protein